MSPNYTIGTLSTLTGLSQHTIRAWERRYEALTPKRSDGNRRIYDDDDVERLNVLKRVVGAGHSIGQVAHLPTDQLRAIDSSSASKPHSYSGDRVSDGVHYLAACQAALSLLDPEALEDVLVRATADFGIMALLEHVVIPLLAEIEVGWLDGSMRISQEHMASAVLRTHLDRARLSMPGANYAPRLLSTTPRNQHHEIGALMVSIVAAMQGWNVTYLGPNLPAEEIAMAARQRNARAVALSLVYPVDDPGLGDELRRLRQMVGPSISIIVGGRAASAYAGMLDEIGGHVSEDLKSFGKLVNQIATSRLA